MHRTLKKYCVEARFLHEIRKHIDYFISWIVKLILAKNAEIDSNKIVFMTYNNDFICNPKYIAEEIIRQGINWDLVWVVPKKGSMLKSHFPEKIRRVRRDSYEAFEEIISAKVWIDNSVNFAWNPIYKKRGQIYIETWHGSMGIKRAGAGDVQNKRWVKAAKISGRQVDYCISNSSFENGVYNDTHWRKAEKLLYGHARNDCLFKSTEIEEAKRKLCAEYDIDANCSIILYAPTFRDDGRLDCYDINYERILESVRQRFGGKWIIFLRLHFHNRKDKIANLPENVINVTNYIDMQELMMAADVGITDYSSWAYDYILMRKPLFIFATDIDEYNNERGLYYPLEETPFSISTNNNQLSRAISDFDDEVYQEKIKFFLDKMGCCEDGHAAERIVSLLKKLMQNNE